MGPSTRFMPFKYWITPSVPDSAKALSSTSCLHRAIASTCSITKTNPICEKPVKSWLIFLVSRCGTIPKGEIGRSFQILPWMTCGMLTSCPTSRNSLPWDLGFGHGPATGPESLLVLCAGWDCDNTLFCSVYWTGSRLLHQSFLETESIRDRKSAV